MENIVTDDTIQREQISSAQPQAENITVRYNHEDKILSREDAVAFAQKGMKYDSVLPLLNELDTLAKIKNKSPLETVKEYISSEQLKNSENKEEKEVFCKLEDKIADEYFQLTEACPEVKSIEDIPDEVFLKAGEISLLDAYLRFYHDEQIKIKEAESKKAENIRATAGEINNNIEDTDSLLCAFIKGLKE